jgi:hypothetical protein
MGGGSPPGQGRRRLRVVRDAHGGQGTTLFTIITNLPHFGMTVVGLNYGFAGQMKVDEITGGVPYGATTIAGLDAQRQPSENELAGARYQVRAIAEPPRNSTAERDQNAAGRWPRRPRNRAERVLAAWKRSRKTRTAWNRPSTTCSPTYGERAARFDFRAWIRPRRLRA